MAFTSSMENEPLPSRSYFAHRMATGSSPNGVSVDLAISAAASLLDVCMVCGCGRSRGEGHGVLQVTLPSVRVRHTALPSRSGASCRRRWPPSLDVAILIFAHADEHVSRWCVQADCSVRTLSTQQLHEVPGVRVARSKKKRGPLCDLNVKENPAHFVANLLECEWFRDQHPSDEAACRPKWIVPLPAPGVLKRACACALAKTPRREAYVKSGSR
eukprot:scaffold39246_cov59-Phaeocystis_antarctica.AAC.2